MFHLVCQHLAWLLKHIECTWKVAYWKSKTSSGWKKCPADLHSVSFWAPFFDRLRFPMQVLQMDASEGALCRTHFWTSFFIIFYVENGEKLAKLPIKNGPGYLVNLVHLLPFRGNQHDRASGIIVVMVRFLRTPCTVQLCHGNDMELCHWCREWSFNGKPEGITVMTIISTMLGFRVWERWP